LQVVSSGDISGRPYVSPRHPNVVSRPAPRALFTEALDVRLAFSGHNRGPVVLAASSCCARHPPRSLHGRREDFRCAGLTVPL